MVKNRNPNERSEVGSLSHLTEDERRALRRSKFAPLPPNLPTSSSQQQQQRPRLAHPGGPITTNKAAALAKYLERKLQQPGGLDSIKPELLELAVKDAKEAVNSGGSSGTIVRHVVSFDDSSEESEGGRLKDGNILSDKKRKRKQQNTENQPHKLKTKKKKKKKKKVDGSKDLNHKKRKNKRA